MSRAQNSCGVPQSVVQERSYDGLGQTIGGQATDAEGAIVTATERDVLGRVIRTANRRRTNEAESAVATEYGGLGRATRLALEDGSAQTIRYAVNWTTSTDAAGKSITRIADSLGRVTSVIEPATTTAGQSTTTYTYDARDRLIAVSQSG